MRSTEKNHTTYRRRYTLVLTSVEPDVYSLSERNLVDCLPPGHVLTEFDTFFVTMPPNE